MYSVEWQKRGLPHAHILIWLVEKIRPNEVDAVISAEIPNVQVDPGLHEVVIKNMIHGPCGTLNQNSPCMMDGLTAPNRPMHDAFNQELHRERLYDLNALKELIQTNLPLLNEQQKYVFETLMKVKNDETGGIYFLDAPGDLRHDPGPLITDGSPYKYKARNSAAVKLVTKALQWHTIDRRGEEGRVKEY
ncbi:hypothetical protein EVAR_54347_1 [Eumeta japonica]|uniref:Helitron helicase-like domain-containing protein n=1 Tax=Eumeta variegata TaxID=151549 RepID=A0A4C1Z6L7_EUMVA|nr:hypothetical protein EVAR_54347_1 [Eumeta japonica]